MSLLEERANLISNIERTTTRIRTIIANYGNVQCGCGTCSRDALYDEYKLLLGHNDRRLARVQQINKRLNRRAVFDPATGQYAKKMSP